MKHAEYLLGVESNAIGNIISVAGQSMQLAIDVLLGHGGKIVICGMGKSGHIARKVAATFTSIGQQAVFLHPSEAVHGDLGVYSPGDPTILISKSGTTDELLRLIPTLKAFDSKIIAIVGNPRSPIAEFADVVIDISFAKEADPLGIVPTTSAIVSLAIGDALAAEIMHARGVTKVDFARFHPAGQLGRNLLLCVGDAMAKIENCARVSPENTLRETVVEMTKYPLGAALVIDGENFLLGIVTDGDIRRSLQTTVNIDALCVESIMTKAPKTIFLSAPLGDAIEMMESGESQISVLPVLDKVEGKMRTVGLLRLHDVYRH
ncbi:MAG: KpsF/GutQ family sugar-phosphate isomerase [Puniceicoccales bacterium]|jgi:arabinose-5-phosphate isomerase|nr:KpsF/GutQ family sugar-phosphate isomerase [Puniceicoccales bacterium]